MATANPFDLLGDIDNDDPAQLIAKAEAVGAKKSSLAPPTGAKVAKLPSKPLPPAQAVREAKHEPLSGRGGHGGRGGGAGGRGGGRGFRDSNPNGSSYGNGFPAGSNPGEDGGGGRSYPRGRGSYAGTRTPFRGGGRGRYGDGETGDADRPRRHFERHSGTGRGNEFKREGAGRGNWGISTDEAFSQVTEELAAVEEKNLTPEKELNKEDVPSDAKEEDSKEAEVKEPEDKEMTLEEYEKIREEKRKALVALKSEERKVVLDKELLSMQQLSLKKGTDDVFIQLGAEKDSTKRKESIEKDERVKKALNINEFLKPAEGERYYSPRGRGRGRGRGDRGGFGGRFSGGDSNLSAAPSIEDPCQFPTLGRK